MLQHVFYKISVYSIDIGHPSWFKFGCLFEPEECPFFIHKLDIVLTIIV